MIENFINRLISYIYASRETTYDLHAGLIVFTEGSNLIELF